MHFVEDPSHVDCQPSNLPGDAKAILKAQADWHPVARKEQFKMKLPASLSPKKQLFLEIVSCLKSAFNKSAL
jgi:hypothetical protein